MVIKEFAEDMYGSIDREPISDSDHVYLKFRQTIDPGMIDAKFDMTPAKSCAFRDRHTGERLTDQTLRSHVLNGTAFGARLNHALRRLDPDAALSDDELLEAMALYACHDLHKTIPAQIRRDEAESNSDADKQIPESEAAVYVDLLRLDELSINLSVADYHASALATEEGSGPHQEAPSRAFERRRDWVRMMDAAAGLTTPALTSGLERRIQTISDKVELASHRLDDTKGLVTNLLNSMLVDEIENLEEVVPLVFFASGVLYLTTDTQRVGDALVGGEQRANQLTEAFIETLRNSRHEFRNPRELTTNLSADYQKGRIGIPPSLYLLAGLEPSVRSVKHLLTDRGEDTFTGYNTYEYSVLVGTSSGVFDNEIPAEPKGVALGLQLSTFYLEIFMPLCGEDRRAAIRHLTEALGIENVGEWIARETETWRLQYTDSEPDSETVAGAATHLDAGEDEVRASLKDGISLEAGGTLSFPVLLGLAFLANGTEGDTSIADLPLERTLEIVESRLLDYYRSWPEEWDETAPIEVESSDTPEEKVERFERDKEGLVWSSFPAYLGWNLEVNGRRVIEVPSSKSKLKEYSSSTQPHVCLLCDNLLVGSGALEDFKSDSFYFGFTHYQPVNPQGGEPTDTVCPQCDIEFTLRKAAYEYMPDAHYLLLAPDYFYSPGDIVFAESVRSQLFLNDYDLCQLAQRIVTGDQVRRARRAGDIFEGILSDEPEGERSEFANLVQNYNRAYEVEGTLGVYRLETPRRDDGDDTVTRIPQWVVSTFATVALAWLTSSRALLTESPIPAVQFKDFPEMARFDQLPGPVKPFSDDSVTISLRRHLGEEPYEIMLRSRLPGQSRGSMANDATKFGLAEAFDPTDAKDGGGMSLDEAEYVQLTVPLHTDIEVTLQTLASLLTITNQQHGTELQRLKTVMDRAKDPFPGAGTILKGDETMGSPTALHAALVLDTLRDPTMSNRIETLAEAGFETLRPDWEQDSNHEYERLFRVARDALSDGLAQNACRDELVDIVAGDVMKAAARADDHPEYGTERYKREPAERFAEQFVDDVYLGICDGDFYELRRQENHLASGYNAAIRRRGWEAADEQSTDTDVSDQ